MRHLFVDSFFYIALINPHDVHHEPAREVATSIGGGRFWTTDLVLVEVANALSAVPFRKHAADCLRKVAKSTTTTIVRLTPVLFGRALTRYEQRRDKGWSLTDCLSFVVMEDHKITEALTGDHHFEQAGFQPVLRGQASI